MRGQSGTVNSEFNVKKNGVMKTPHLILYYPLLTSLVSVIIRFMGILSALLLLLVFFCILIFQGSNFLIILLWVFEVCCILNVCLISLHILNAGLHLIDLNKIKLVFKKK